MHTLRPSFAAALSDVVCEVHAEGHTLFARPFSPVKGVCQEEVGRRAQWPRVCPELVLGVCSETCQDSHKPLSLRRWTRSEWSLRGTHYVGGLSNELIWPEVSSSFFFFGMGWGWGNGRSSKKVGRKDVVSSSSSSSFFFFSLVFFRVG